MIKICLYFSLLLSLNAWAVNCRDGDNDGFDINDDGTVTDIESGLTWMRCSLGQAWNGDTCTGPILSISWSQALQQTIQLNETTGFAGAHDWRLPRLNELASLANQYCQTPRLNLSLFPSTPAAGYWVANTVPRSEQKAYILSFGREGVSQEPVSANHHVRLVRGRERE